MEDEGLHNTLKVQRAKRDLTQADLAALAGVTRKSVNAIETGNMVPSVLLALKLARGLGVSVDTIFTLSGQRGPLPAYEGSPPSDGWLGGTDWQAEACQSVPSDPRAAPERQSIAPASN